MSPISEEHRLLRQAHREEAAELAKRACEPVRPGEKIAAQIARAARALGFSYTRTEDLWRMEARRIDSWEMDWMRRMKRRKKRPKSGDGKPR